MADRMYAKIIIGGELPAEHYEALRKLCEEHMGGDWELKCEPGAQVEVMASEVAYGRFEDLEAFCKKHGLTYWAFHEGVYGEDAEIITYDPSDGEEGSYLADKGQSPCIALEFLQQSLASGEPLADVVKMLEGATPERVPVLTLKGGLPNAE